VNFSDVLAFISNEYRLYIGKLVSRENRAFFLSPPSLSLSLSPLSLCLSVSLLSGHSVRYSDLNHSDETISSDT